jgi:hypothetical protein
MPRLKTYYTADETTNNLFTTGKEWQLLDGTEYKGAYHRYLTGEIYTGAIWDFRTSKKLVRYESTSDTKDKTYKKLKSELKLSFSTPNTAAVSVTTQDIQRGYITRYFFKKYDNENIQETNFQNYNIITTSRADRKLYSIVTFKWYITGDQQDTYKNGVLVPGVVSKNSKIISQANQKLKGISNLLTNPLQYYSDTDFIRPVDINGLDS